MPAGRRRLRLTTHRTAAAKTGHAGEVVARLDRAFRAAGDPVRARGEKAYLKSPLRHYGVTVPGIRKAVADLERERGPWSRTAFLAAVRALWGSDAHEHRMAAVVLLEEHADLLLPRDLPLLKRMIRGSFTWAYVDGLAANAVGPLLERSPELTSELDCWVDDPSFWIRRAALLALLGPLRRGSGDWARFRRYAERLLDDNEFFVRKAIGWVLRETSKRRPDLVRRYVLARGGRMSGVTFREAVRRLPEAERDALVRAREAS